MPSQGTISPGRTRSRSPTAIRSTGMSSGPGQPEPVRHPGRGRLQGAHRLGGTALGEALHRLAAGLHQDDDQSRQRLAQDQRGDDRQRRHEVGGELAAKHADGRAHQDGEPGHDQAEPARSAGAGMRAGLA